jgi:hypothetical protein
MQLGRKPNLGAFGFLKRSKSQLYERVRDSIEVVEKNGGQGRNRTADAGLFRAALYQLSYLAMGV